MCTWCAGAVFAQEGVAIKVAADKTIVTVGTRIHYRVEITYSDPVVLLSDIPNDHVAQFTVKDINDSITQPDSHGRRVLRREYVLVPYDIGERVIAPLTINYKKNAEEATVSSISSESIIITVETVAETSDVDDIRHIKDIVDMKKTLMRYATVAGGSAVGLVILALLIALGRALLRRLRTGDEHLLTPFERAMKRLFELRSSKMIAEGKISEFTDKVSDIVRAFLGTAFKFETMDLTTTELDRRCAEVGVAIEVHNRLNQFLQDCDLVKFARHEPTTQELDHLFNEAKGLVEMIESVTKHAEEKEDDKPPAGHGEVTA